MPERAYEAVVGRAAAPDLLLHQGVDGLGG